MTAALITGVAGFTGRYVAEALAGSGLEVHGIVHGASLRPFEGVAQLHDANVTDLSTLARIVQEVRPQHVVHLAAHSFVADRNIDLMYCTNVLGTRHLLEALSHLEQPPRSILLASSANVYGNAREGVLDETMPAAPANDYGVSKLAMEHVASLYADKLPIIIVRPFNYTGRGQSTDFLVPKIVAHARDRAPVLELGNLDVARDFSDVRTVAHAYIRLLETPEAIGGTYNVCSGRAVTLKNVLDLVWRLTGHRFDVRVNPAFVRKNEVHTLVGSLAKLESLIGPLPAIPLEETLRWMLEP